MKYMLKSYGLILLILSISFLDSCKKEDNISPVITSLNLSTNDTIRNTFLIKVEATDNKGISKIEYYANDSLIAEVYKTPFDYQLNTLEMKDGNYTIKVIVYDKEGNKTESSSNVAIQNVLLYLKMGFLYSVQYYIVVSDENGNILNSTTFISNDTKKIMPLLPFEDKAINIVYYCKQFDLTYIYGYVHVKRGSEFKLGFSESGPPDKNFKLHLRNDVGFFTQINASIDRTWYELNSMADTSYLSASIPYTLNHKLLLQLNTGTSRLYKFFTVENGDNLSVNLSSIDKLQLKKSFSLPGVGYGMYSISGRVNNENGFYDCFISLGSNDYNTDHLNLYYPPEYFTQYTTGLYWHDYNTNKTYQNIYVGDVPASFSKMDADAEILSQSSGNFRANLSGVFDFYEAYYANTKCCLSVLSPADKDEWKLPDLSKAVNINDLNFSNLVLFEVTLRDFEKINWTNKYYDLNEDIKQLFYTDKYQKNLIIQVNPYKKSVVNIQEHRNMNH